MYKDKGELKMEANVYFNHMLEVGKRPLKRMSDVELYRFAQECCSYVEKQMANEEEFIIVDEWREEVYEKNY